MKDNGNGSERPQDHRRPQMNTGTEKLPILNHKGT